MPGLDRGAVPEAGDNVWLAAGNGHVDDVELFLKTGGMGGGPLDADCRDANGYSPLHAAASYGHVDLVRLLVAKYGANPNIRDNDGDTPLHLAETAAVARALVELGADPKLRNDDGRLPIEIAYTERWNQAVEYLKEFTPEFERIEEDDDEDDDDDDGPGLSLFDYGDDDESEEARNARRDQFMRELLQFQNRQNLEDDDDDDDDE